jgi:uncharacterized protein (DUF1800 family)
MTPSPRRLIFPLAAASVWLSLGTTWAQEGVSDRAEIVHVLDRITFGPRPGDVEMVQQMGLHAYIESQLHPENIDDSAVEQTVAQFDLLQMTAPQLTELFRDELKKNLKKLKQASANGQNQTTAPSATPPPASPAPAMQTEAMQLENQDKPALTGGQDQIEPPTQAANPPADAMPGMTKMEQMVNRANQNRSVAAIGELEQAKLVRAIESPRQLQEVLVDFWTNHFNIDVKKGPDRVFKVIDDREVIRPHIFGKFRDLLEASAKSPAMLFYLDNALSSVPHELSPMQQRIQAMMLQQVTGQAPDPTVAAQPLTTKKQGGINENYAREIMELHTLGVDAGYTQQDVQEVARCFTGWSIDRQTGEFAFHPRQHDNGEKVVLGQTIPAGGGMQDGETVLDILCAQPACAHFISRELCQRFVADDPPPALVDRVAGVFTQTGGDLRAVTEAILTSPEFLSPTDYGNKIKSPLEFAVSAVRASDSTFIAQPPPPFDKILPALEGAGVLGRGQAADRIAQRPRQSLNWHILDLGEPLFACTPPTGYKEVSRIWVNPGALIERLNFALALTQQKISDVQFDPRNILAGTDLDNPEAVLNQCVAVLLQNNISDSTRKVLEQTVLPSPTAESRTVDASKLIALIIGSPEFQRK